VPAVTARPHPGATLRRGCGHLEDAPDHYAVLQHVIVVVTPTRGVAALEDERGHTGVAVAVAALVALVALVVEASASIRLVQKLEYRQREEERRRDDPNANRRQ
jgi:hypothetical protein